MGASSHKRSLLSLLVTWKILVGLTGLFSRFRIVVINLRVFMGFMAKVLVSPRIVHMGS
jgi:hypothetical protein